jgi:DNA-binding transcriptional ArsR family regulator
MDVEYSAEKAVSRIAAAIGEPARARILYCLLDRHARTSTELALFAEVSPSTASVHLTHLRDRGLVRVLAQGKHRYYSLEGAHTAAALEALMLVAVGPDNRFFSNTPQQLRAARTCYDHMAGTVAVAFHDRFEQLGWLTTAPAARRFASGCVDWSERKPHIAGALGVALLSLALKRKWLTQDLDSRALRLTRNGQREPQRQFGVRL